MSDGRKYSIGDGRQRPKGWITVDADSRVEPDIVAELPPVPEMMNGAEAFRLIHVLEHVHKWEAEEMLRGLHRALRSGGRLVLELPNLDSAIAALSGASGRSREKWGMWVLYGDPGHKNSFFSHKWGWTPATLRATLTECGFRDELISDERPRFHVPDRDFRLVALKE